jgi:hypothetical protein
MLEYAGLNDLAREIESLGYDEKIASHYAALIGDTPVFDEDGYILILSDDNQIVARLDLKFYGPRRKRKPRS